MLKRLITSSKKITKRALTRPSQIPKLISFNSQNYSKFYRMSSEQIIQDFDNISQIESNNRAEQIKEKLILINHTREQIAIEAGQNPNYVVSLQKLGELSQQLQATLTQEDVNTLNSEELYCLMSGFLTEENSDLVNYCMLRFYDLIKEDLRDESYGADMRVMECHMFSKIIGVIGLTKEPFVSAEAFGDFELYVDSFVKRHRGNFSFFDKALALSLIIDVGNPISGNF